MDGDKQVLPALPELVPTGTPLAAEPVSIVEPSVEPITNPFDKKVVPVQRMASSPTVTPLPITEPKTTVVQEKVSTSSVDMKGFPIIGAFIVVIVLLIAAISGMLLLTESGRKIIGLGTVTSSSSISSSTTSSDSANDFSNEDADGTVEKITTEIDEQTTDVNSENDFESFDSQVEFGL